MEMFTALGDYIQAKGQGVFITFEGGEGGGKSTHIAKLREMLSAEGFRVTQTREPGGCPVHGKGLREMILTGENEKWFPFSELLLYTVDRNEHLERVVRPALDAGKVVLCDRFVDSTFVYQGMARGLDYTHVQALQNMVIGETWPDLTLVFDIDAATGLKRSVGWESGENRMEKMGLEFHEKVRSGFQKLVQENHKGRFMMVDASRDIDAVFAEVCGALATFFEKKTA